MAWFVFACIFALLAAAAVLVRNFIISPHSHEHASNLQQAAVDRVSRGYAGPDLPFYVNGRRAMSMVASVLGTIALLLGVWSTVRSVPVHSSGVEVSFGKVEGDLRPGLNFWNAPWTGVTIMDETVQSSVWSAPSWNGSDTQNPGCLIVRIGGQQLGCANLRVKWQVEDARAPKLFNQYDNQGTDVMTSIKANLVDADIQEVMNEIMGDYNPILDAQLTAANGGNVAAPSQYTSFGPKIQAALQKLLGNQIRILPDGVVLSQSFYQQVTESRLSGIQNQVADTAIAAQQYLTDQKLAAANNALAKSLTPEILQHECYTVTQDIYNAHGTMNVGWNCTGTPSLALSGK